MRGAVYKRGSTWTWHFDIDPDPLTGRRRQRTKGGYLTKKAAEQALAEAIGQWRTGRLPQRSTHTLSHFLQEEWLPAVKPRLRPSTWANYRTYIAAYVVPILGQVKLQALTPVQLNHLYAHLLERGRRKTIDGGRTGLSPKTVRNVHVMLHSALHDAMRWGYLVRNVAEAADPPAARTPEQKVWSPQELGAFLDHVRDDRLYALWLLVATTGMRRGELAGLRWVDIDFDHATVSPAGVWISPCGVVMVPVLSRNSPPLADTCSADGRQDSVSRLPTRKENSDWRAGGSGSGLAGTVQVCQLPRVIPQWMGSDVG